MTRKLGTCEKCGREGCPVWRCQQHAVCDDCGRRPPEVALCYHDGGLYCDPCFKIRVEAMVEEFQRGDHDTADQNSCICPHCGRVQQDDFEIDDGLVDCQLCERQFEVSINTIRTFSTRRVGG